ncbi:hypothetical protein SISNIDRAFT_174671 [Sistotremastrum niveocremeum HHB9708]|uniref:F-box domain-containing protein n=1 Tax=Sistotremastrum niveocremeum HHB9708 TaxID=1314777 RepID=A0A164RMY7_9AGAM|nr:hypothetical protein SISNIDRAFT_174671 [Sistotremastrum niveocremeum HHB9708]
MHGADWYLVRRLYLKKYTCITHICYRLRDVAIQDARLWSDIDLLWPPQVIEEFALRAKDFPLSLNLNLVRYHHDPTYMPHILDPFTIAMSKFWIPFYEKNVDRVRHLTFHNRIRIGEHGSNFREFHLLRDLWNVIRALPAPKLETCYLEAQPWERIDNLFSGHAPLLQSIVLASPFLGLLGLEKFESLVCLDLSGINNEPEQSDLPDIRVILSHVPQLQRLSISCSRLFKDSEFASTEMGSTSKNELSNCSKLVLQDLLATDIIHLLSIISFPALENLCIEAYITEASQTTIVYSSLPSRFVDLCSRSREVRFEVQNNIIFMEAGSSVDKPRTLEFLGRLCDVAVEGIAQFATDSLTAPFKTLKMRPTTLGLRFMETLDEEIYSTKFWKTVFACAPKLVNLVNVQSVPSMPFIEALDELDVICPSLRRIRYDSAQQPFKPDIEDDTDLPMRQKQQDAVRRFFQQRKERRKERKRSMKQKQGEGSMAPPLPQQSR